jgi:ABC-2 type transport system ATP-binding protein
LARMSGPSIEAVNLSKRYGSFTALSNLNLKIEGSKCVGFLGPNGAGKTTTLKIFTDMIRASEGKALINGVDVHLNKKKALASVGTLIESPEIYPALTPREALSMVAEIRGLRRADAKKKIDETVGEVKMTEWLDKKVGKFSKGMKQRINIAAALLSDPEVVMLDEPTTGLDPRGQAEVRDIVRSLKTRNRLIFMSSHLLNEVQEICDEVAMIDHGKLLVYDTLSNVTNRYSTDGRSMVEVELSRDVDEQTIGKNIASLANVVSAERPAPRKLRIYFSGGVESQEKLLLDLANLKIGLISFHPSGSALEDTYLKMIKDTL